MSTLRALQGEIMSEGVDLAIDRGDWDRIRAQLPATGCPTTDDLQALIEMRASARSVCQEFDAYFFPALKNHILADGRVSPGEHYQLLRLLYGGGGIDPAEQRFLEELKSELREVTPEFEAMYRQAMRD